MSCRSTTPSIPFSGAACDRRDVRIRLPSIALAAAVAGAALVYAGPVYADDPPRREVPDLDGRPPSDANDVADALLWIPRILTGPLYLVSEYLIRAPLGALLTPLEEEGVLDVLFASGGQFGFIPTLYFEFGTSPSVGFYAFADRFPFEENRISLHAAMWGDEWIRTIVKNRTLLGSGLDLVLRFEARRRPDQLVEGIGFNATDRARARFGVNWLEARAELNHRVWRRTRFVYFAGYRSVGFDDRGWNGDPSVYQRGGNLPAGYATGYELFFARAHLTLDTHNPVRELTRARLRARFLVESNAAFGGLTQVDDRQLLSSWIRWGGELAVSTDFLGQGRVLMLRFQTELVSPIDPDLDVVPFYELPDAGGSRGPFPGFITGQLRGQSMLGLRLEYVWPVFALLDGVINMTIGNAFGVHYEDFAFERLRLGWGIGIVPRFSGEHLVEVTFGLGTDTFENGTNIVQGRLTVGARHGL